MLGEWAIGKPQYIISYLRWDDGGWEQQSTKMKGDTTNNKMKAKKMFKMTDETNKDYLKHKGNRGVLTGQGTPEHINNNPYLKDSSLDEGGKVWMRHILYINLGCLSGYHHNQQRCKEDKK